MAALVIAWPAGMLPNKKLSRKISREAQKEGYSEICVISFGKGGVDGASLKMLKLWDAHKSGKTLCFGDSNGLVWTDSSEMLKSEDVYICGRNTQTQVLGICLGLSGRHKVHVISDLCVSDSLDLQTRAMCVIGASIGFVNIVQSRDTM